MLFSLLMLTVIAVGVVTIGILLVRLKQARARASRSEHAAAHGEAQRRQLIQHMGHEIRNPLNAILGMCDLVMHDAGVPIDRRQNLMVMRSAAQQLLMVSTNLFAYHAGDDQLMERRSEIVSIPELVEDARDCAGSLIAQRRLRIDVFSEAGCPYQVEADSQILRHIVSNVLSHSIGLTTHGHITVHTHCATAENLLLLSISDTGPTLDSRDSSRMFEPYGLETQLRSAVEPGTGLNLFVARKLARQLGGDVTHRTHPNSGSIYEITLPTRILSTKATERGSSASVVVAFNDLYIRHRECTVAQRILVTEDQRSNQQLIVTILTKAGHTATVASTGSESLALLQSEAFDLAIMDLRLPGISGLDVMKLSRLNSKANSAMPFIVLTGETGEDIRLACVGAGAAAFLAKPISAQRLLDTVSAVTERMALRDEREPPNDAQLAVSAEFNDPAMAALTPRVISESMRDALRYAQDASQACRDGNVELARQRIRAIRGTAHAVSAKSLVEACRRLLTSSDETLRSSPEAVARELDDALTETQKILATILHDGSPEHA